MAHTRQYEQKKAALLEAGYRMCRPDEFDFSVFKYLPVVKRSGRGSNDLYNDALIMADTETSKSAIGLRSDNHVVAWTISIRAYHQNIVTFYGSRPDDMVRTFQKIQKSAPGEKTIIYFHNLSYDYVFLRQFLFAEYGTPNNQLNTKPYYPIYIDFKRGLQLRDSLILSQRSLDKWGKDMNVEHQKASGKWDYEKIRNQCDTFTADELEYIEHDTLCGVECLDATMQGLNKHIYSIPYTATGIPREESRKRGKKNRARDYYIRTAPTWAIQQYQELVYHGGYTHGNRHIIGWKNRASGRDFSSSYPYNMLVEKMPCEQWGEYKGSLAPDQIMQMADNYAFMFRLKMVKPRLKSDWVPMPCISSSKCVQRINAVLDNGRILCASYLEICITELDLETILEQYDADVWECDTIYYATKDYLPRWFTDYVYECFKEKTELKGGDPVLYSIAKAKLNSLYGMCVQRPVKVIIEEDYLTGEYRIADGDNFEELYEKHVKNHNSILPYCWGIWTTAAAQRNLFKLGACVADGETWLYSDTDSVYATGWDEKKLEAYNNDCKKKLMERGYPAIVKDGKEYWLGVAMPDPEMEYEDFITVGAKRYAGRSLIDGKIHITVAGVPKKNGAKCLNDDLDNFKTGFVFQGEITGKKLHTYFFHPEGIWEDEQGNICADSIDLSPDDYTLDDVKEVDWQKIFEDEISIQDYEGDADE